ILSENVTSIGDYAFSGCTALEELTLPESLTELGECFIASTAIASITIPKNVSHCGRYDGNGPLANCKTLKAVIFEDGTTKIPDYIMASGSYNCYVSKVVIPPSVLEIGDHSFYNCDNIVIYGYLNSYALEYAEQNGISFLAVAIAKNATAEEVLQHMNLKSLISNISLGNTTVNGPSITIAGNTFSLFSFNAAATLKLNDKVQAKVDMQKKTVQVLIGFDKFQGSATLDKDTNSSNYWKESYQQVKSLYKGVMGANASTDKLYHGFQKLRGKLRKTNCAIGIDASAEVAGYAEFSFASGEIIFTSGGIALKASVGYEETLHWPVCPAAYVVFGLDAGFNGQLKLERTAELKYAPSMDADIDLTAKLGVGAGSKKLSTYVEAGLQGNINMGVSLPAKSLANALKLSLSASVYIDSKLFGFDGPSYGPKKFASAQIYPKNRSNKTIMDADKWKSFDWEHAVPMERSYLQSIGKQNKKANSARSNVTFEKNNLYPYNNARVVNLKDGTKLLFWIDDDGSKSDINKTTLMYAKYDGSTWGKGKKIAETGGANDYPSVYSDGTKAIVVWQKAAKMADNASLTDVLKSVELYAVVYENGKLGEAEAITASNESYEMMQTVTVSDDKIAVAWVENSENDPFMVSGSNTVKLAVKENGKWAKRTISAETDAVRNINLEYVSGELAIVYENDKNESSVIHFERGAVKKTYSGQCAQIENGVLYFSDNTSLQSYDILTGYEEAMDIPAMNDFVLVDNGKAKAVYTTVYNGYRSELAMYPFDISTGRWGDIVTLTNYGKYIRDYSVSLDSTGNPAIALNLIDINENADTVYGNSTLKVLDASDYVDLVLTDNITYEESLIKENGKLPISFEVKNNSGKPLNKFTANILDENENMVLSKTVDCNLAAGDTAMAQVIYELPGTVTRHQITLQIEAENEVNLSNNSKKICIGYADLSIENLHMSGIHSKPYLEGAVRNIGYDAAENVKVNLYDGDSDAAFETVGLNTMASGDNNTFTIEIPEKCMEINPLATGNIIRVEVVSDTEELNYGNNEDEFLILPEEEMSLILNANSLELKTGEDSVLEVLYCNKDISGETILWTSSNDKVATVANGKVNAVKAGSATITAAVLGMEASCKITVTDNIEEGVQAVVLDTNSINIITGQSQKLTASVLPSSAKNSRFTWSSEDTSIAAVKADGQVTGIRVGETTITATAEDGYHMAYCRVVVSQDKNQTYTVNFAGGEGASGQSPAPITDTAESIVILPKNPYHKTNMLFAGWSDGKETYKEGDAYRIPYHDVTFTALWNKDGQTEHIITAVSDENGKISPEGKISVKDGENQTFVMVPASGYKIEDVIVDGKSIGAIGTYTFRNVTKTHTISVAYAEADTNKVLIESISLSEKNAEISVGETLALSAKIMPYNATDTALTWSSSDESIATVDNIGLVTARRQGKASITATAKDGSNASASCDIIVGKAKQKLSGKTAYEKQDNDVSFDLGVKLTEGDGAVSYTSSNPAVVTVDASGRVSIKGTGTATVTVIAAETDNYQKTTLEITINVSAHSNRPGTIVIRPVETQTPAETEKPGETKAPAETVKPSETKAPMESEKPSETKTPIVTEKPGETKAPARTENPSETSKPSKTDKPSVTKIPKINTKLTDKSTKSVYKVTKPGVKNGGSVTGAEVAYFKSAAKAKVVKIPQTVTINAIKYKVTSISNNAFKNNKIVTKVKMGNTIVTIGKNAFLGCKKLKTVTLGKKLKTLKEKAFCNCVSLTKAAIPNKVAKIGKMAFSGCKKLKDVKIGKNVTVIDAEAFIGCTSLTIITFPSRLKKIGSKAFYKCKNLRYFMVKTNKLTAENIGEDAFSCGYSKPRIKTDKSMWRQYLRIFTEKGMSEKALYIIDPVKLVI
ncbi:MAG: leucine-rich repeat protein, partial [Lachnospiraceae bacterium]|nr:leucine-rich repeat protein [Lachnospiraceae bacterium]